MPDERHEHEHEPDADTPAPSESRDADHATPSDAGSPSDEPSPETAPPAPTTPEPPAILGERPVPKQKKRKHEVKQHEGSIKETIISMMISLAMALVAKAYVIEAFVIPTGSMAPTLLGKHMQFASDQTGYEWTVNPWFEQRNGNPLPLQKIEGMVPQVTDPMTVSRVNPAELGPAFRNADGFTVSAPATGEPIHAGDRILVHKYLYEIFPPKRFDVVVFKNPEDATINFIKRLIGLPNEQIWLADGDVFARPITTDEDGTVTSTGAWEIKRKPTRVQRDVWRPIFSSEFVPLEPTSPTTGRRWFRSPWQGADWETEDRRVYRTDSAESTNLSWDVEGWPITDWEPYNDIRYAGKGQSKQFPVADLRMRAVVTPDNDDLRLVATIRARGHRFQAALEDGDAIVRMRDEPGPWQELARAKGAAKLRAGVPRKIEFWHVDQSLQIRIDGRKIVEGTYDWDPGLRLFHSTGKDGNAFGPSDQDLAYAGTYVEATPTLVQWTFQGSPVTLSRVGLDRDLFYQPRTQLGSRASRRAGPGRRTGAALGTHPANLVALKPDQFFMLGDNSPSSKDGRLWDRVDPEIAAQIDPDMGIVNRKLLLGKAFFVYFPAPHTLSIGGLKLWMPDFGHMRFIK